MIKPDILSGVTNKVTSEQTVIKTGRRWFSDQWLYHAVLIFLLVLMLLPFIWMLATALKSDYASTPASLTGQKKDLGTLFSLFWPGEFHFENFTKAWTGKYSTRVTDTGFFDAPFTQYFFNSLVVGVLETAGVLFTSILAAYAFARMEFWGKSILFTFILATMAIPHEATYIPNLVIVSQLGQLVSWLGTNSYTALFLPWIASAFYIFLLRQFFMSIPQELYEAAQLDGIGELGFLWRIAIPLSSPAILTVALFAFLGNWNAFLWPLIAAPNIPVVQTGLRLFVGNTEVATQWNLLMAASTIVILPIVVLYFLVQQRFIEGISRSGLK
ncbi:MAG TPA: carbohydrate ABC transporter permease [Chloroflexia bacterium]|nr:carbohydrate ABC transporter permease [Chloroflexia bacterium]